MSVASRKYGHSIQDNRNRPFQLNESQLKCDVVTEPTYQNCDRCKRLKLVCKIDTNFKRIGKRSRNAQMEREIAELRAQLASQQGSPITIAPTIKTPSEFNGTSSYPMAIHDDTESGAAVASLMDLASGGEAGSFMRSPNAQLLLSKRLGDVVLSTDQVQELFRIFFTYYHPFVPLLDPQKTVEDYYDISKLLFWVIISVAARRYGPNRNLLSSIAKPLSELLWHCIAEVPQNHNIVKALCLLCTWPFPVSSTSLDPTFMLCGLAMGISMQLGLHRPSHTQDFSKIKIELREEELRDRVRTWAAANCVAQRVSTGLGQPPSTIYDWTLVPTGKTDPGFLLPQETEHRLLIERFNNKVTKALYMSQSDPVGLTSEQNRQVLTEIFAAEYRELEQKVSNDDDFIMTYLHAAGLHLRLSAFFDSPSSKDYYTDLHALYEAATTYLETALNLHGSIGSMLIYSTNYVLQMIIAAAFTLLKLLSSFFASFVDLDYGKRLFTRTIFAIRSISVQENDLPSRFGEVLAQFWRASGAGSKTAQVTSDASENSLQLKVKCRMSMSLVYDSAWRWREEFQARGSLDTAVKNPTLPDSTADSSATSNAGDGTLAPSNLLEDTIAPGAFSEGGYNEVFDPLSWMFDGDVEFPKFTLDDPAMEGQAMALL